MNAIFDRYPVYEANQVLTSRHLNDGFDYADEQARLTRSRLIGIGIVCGLEIRLDASGAAIDLSQGCGVTSEGYLIIEPEDVSLVASRAYTLPPDIDYPPFKASDGTQLALWELFPAGEPNTTPLDADATFLDGKAMLLLLELKKQGLRNCSPNNCDDKGAEVTATVRRLLIAAADLDKVIAAGNALDSGLTASDLDAALSARLGLPDIRVRRFDVLNTTPATSNDVYAAFLNVFRGVQLAQATGNALGAAYAAFRPLLLSAYPANPFASFNSQFGFLDTAPASATQVRFLQYYVGLFEDLTRAYDEFRWKGAELLCACCPPEELFPRHLMLGLPRPGTGQPGRYRNAFLPSPAVGACVAESKELLQLFTRLVEMAARFTNSPALPKANPAAQIDPQIRITPSVLGDDPLARRAIPYYYRQNGNPPLYRVWDGEKTRRNRANQNLGYRYDEYSPAAPPFVSDPLRYDLEPRDFLRIEGHLGKRYQDVLGTLLLLKSQYRLPVDVIAVRAGVYDDTQPVDLTKETARFQDLEALYDALREELLSSLAAGAMDLYDIKIDGSTIPGGAPQLQLLKAQMPNYRYPAGSLGGFYEQHLQSLQAVPYIDVDQTLMSDPAFAGQVLRVYCILFAGVTGLPSQNFAHVVCLFYFSKLAEILPGALDLLGYADFENKYQDLLALVRYFRSDAIAQVPANLQTFAPRVQLIDDFSEVLHGCKLDAIKSVHLEYVRRVSELKKRQFLSHFLQHHPGIQHKAGVPLGGTFVVVYHGVPPAPLPPRNLTVVNAALFADAFTRDARLSRLTSAASVTTTRAAAAETELGIAQVADSLKTTNVKALALTDAISRISSDQTLVQNPNVSFVIGALTGKIPLVEGRVPPAQGVDDRATRIINATVNELVDGTVIADFFLPYRVSTDAPGAQYVLPKTPPLFTATAACTNADGFASVTVDVRGGDAPYDVSVDEGAYQPLTRKTLSLRAGDHTLKLRDSVGAETPAQSIAIPDPIVLGAPEFACQDAMYTATFAISGGTPPYTVNGNSLAGDVTTFTTDRAASGTSVTVEVRDSVQCAASATFTHTCPTCDLPCAGISLRRGYRMWLPDPEPNNPYARFELSALVFRVETAPGQSIDLSTKIRPIISASPNDLNGDFPNVVGRWLKQINEVIRNALPALNPADVSWLTLEYRSNGPGRLGTLWLEYFECLGFEISIASTISFRRLFDGQMVRLEYTPAGTAVVMDHRDVRDGAKMPPFDGTKIDKCDPNRPETPLCEGRPRIELRIDTTARRGTAVTLGVTAAPSNANLEFVWEAQNAKPAMGNGQTFNTTFVEGTTVGTVAVTAFTEAGCTVTETARIELGGPAPPVGGTTPIRDLPIGGVATPVGGVTPTPRPRTPRRRRNPP